MSWTYGVKLRHLFKLRQPFHAFVQLVS